MKITPTPEARNLAKQIVKDANDVRVKFGRTNGKIVLHVYEPGRQGYTIDGLGAWATCPLNPEYRRALKRTSGTSAEREQEVDVLTSLIANKDAI